MKTKCGYLIGIMFFLLVCFVSITQAGVKVYDANDQYLGINLGGDISSGRIWIYIPSNGKKFRLENTSSGTPALRISGSTIHFKSSDCSGQPYVYSEGLFDYIVGNCANDQYFETNFNATEEAFMDSYINYYDPDCECLVRESPYLGPFAPLIPLQEPLPFSLPIQLPLRFESDISNPLAKPHTFESGEPARAEEVNENFDVLFNYINK